MGNFMQELDCDKLSYKTYVNKEISELNITSKYRDALIKCIERIFDPSQLLEDIHIDEVNRKMIAAEKNLVFTRFYASENDVLFACPHSIEDKILRYYRTFISQNQNEISYI